MSLERGTATLEKTPEVRSGEIDKLPERMGMQRESDCLPDSMGIRRESDCLSERLGIQHKVNDPSDVSEAERMELQDKDLEKLKAMLDTPERIQELMKAHPEKTELWKSLREAVQTLNNPDATDAEKRSSIGKLSAMQGQILEIAVKDLAAEKGLSVESKQRTVEGQDGATRPDVIAKNETSEPISIFGVIVKPGETISIECKCGVKSYLSSQLRDHIPNQLSGQIGHKVLLTTGDIRQVDSNLVQDTCKKYGARLVALAIRASDVRDAIKGVSVL